MVESTLFNVQQKTKSHESDRLYSTEASSLYFFSKTKFSNNMMSSLFPAVLSWRRPQHYSLYLSPSRVVVTVVYSHFKGVIQIII